MKKFKVCRRLLSLMLVFTVLFSGLSLNLNNLDFNEDTSILEDVVDNVDAYGGGISAGGSGGSATNPGNSGKPDYHGSGWRISVMPTYFVYGEDPNKSGTIFTSPKTWLLNSWWRQWGVVITNTDRATLGSGYTIAYSDTGACNYISHTFYDGIGTVFTGIDATGFTPQSLGNNLSSDSSFCQDFWNGTFKTYVETYQNWCVNRILELSGYTATYGAVEDTSTLCIVVEPVAFYKFSNIAPYVLGWQDIAFANGGLTASATDVIKYSSLDSIIASTGTAKKVTVASQFVVYVDITYQDGSSYSVHRDTTDHSMLNGYQVFGAFTPPPYVEGTTGTSFTIWDDNVLSSDKIGDNIAYSTNMLIEDYYSTSMDGNTSSSTIGDLPSGAKNTVYSSYGKSLKTTFNTSAFGSNSALKTGVLGIDSSTLDTLDDSYTLLTAGEAFIDYIDASSASTSSITNATSSAKGDISDYYLNSKKTAVSGYNRNFGDSYSIRFGKNSDSTKKLSEATETFANILASNSIYKNSSADSITEGDYSGKTSSNVITNFAMSATWNNGVLTNLDSSEYTTNGTSSQSGVAVSVFVKEQPVTSSILYATYDYKDRCFTAIENFESKTYDAMEHDSFTIDKSYGNNIVIVTSNSTYDLTKDKDGSEILDNYKNSQCMTLASDLANAAKDAGLDSKKYWTFDANGGENIGVGCDESGYGYSIIVLRVNYEDITEVDAHYSSTRYLHDYQLNYIHPTYADKFISLNDTVSYTADGSSSSASKVIKASSNYGGTIIDYNKNLGANKNILKFNNAVNGTSGDFTTELNARNGYTFESNFSNIKFSMAINQIRSSFADKLVVSSISSQTLPSNFRSSNLGLTSGNKPNTAKKASAKRNSNATVGGTLTDWFSFDVTYVASGQARAYTLVLPANTTVLSKTVGTDYGKQYNHTTKEIAYKYQTDSIAKAENSEGTINLVKTKNGGNNSTSSMTNLYKLALVKTSSKTLSFYPEVAMKAYSSVGDTINSTSDVTKHTVKVMGEVKRSLEPSALYTLKVTQPSSVAVTGKTLSDSYAVGSNAFDASTGLPVIYAGGNISLTASPTVTLEAYGYALDLIKTSDTALTGTGNYTSVVADGSNIYTAWGNSGYTPKSEFDTWLQNTVNNIGIDFTLKVNGSNVNKTYNNFNATLNIGQTNDTITSTEDGVFNIRVKYGTIVEDGGYNALINQIKADYGCTTDEAKAYFKNSNIYQTIANAVEDSADSFNTSQKATTISSKSHWYDEEVKTFVVRRYKSIGIKLSGIVVADKLDYGAAPTANTNTTSNNSYKKAQAKWYMTVYFKSLPAGMTSSGVTLYNPASYSTLNSATTSGSVLISELYVSGADFIVPSASTSDMGH